MGVRTCSVCQRDLPDGVFSKDRRRKSGLAGRCKDCKASADWRRNGEGTPEQEWREPDLRILSLGAGVQSSAVLLMSCYGELPKLDGAVFADAGWEPPETYEWLRDVLVPEAENAGIPLHIVQAGDIRETVRPNGNGFVSLPAFVMFEGKRGMLRRQCTKEFKIVPVRSMLYKLSGYGAKNVAQWFGISVDELGRMTKSDVLYVRNEYPLVDRNLTREDCQDWLVGHGFGRAPRSACIGCPYHSDAEWAAMKRDAPEQFGQAVRFEQDMRAAKERLNTYLHSSCVPLDQVEFKVKGAAGEECAGYCWT